ncbi:MAG: gliding motility-associated C-terminal domain-containing protein [Bacteroidia bacterium]|nr:gliding motility-associated C-terminal domain-containing protein [Bacteroidia bacterium]
MGFIRKIILLVSIVSLPFAGQSQLVVSNQPPYDNIQYLVQNVLLGTGIQAFNITYTGATVAVGYFNGMSSNVMLDSGIVFTSGHIDSAVGPNNTGWATVINSTPGDVDLENITNNTMNGSYDAAVIEFDFIPMADTVKFDYVFGSEEYMEWVNTGFNDAFAFILSGVSTPLVPTNIALIPAPPAPPNTPVTIDNVNLNSYPQYYFDNETPPGLTVNYDGFTVPMRAQYPVICGETYHIKLVVADIGDGAYDSGVFLKAGSFSASQVTISTNISYGGPNDSTLFESCGTACIVFDRGNSNLQNPDTITLTFSGNAVNGVDIVPAIPNQLIFAPGQDSIVLCFSAPQDNITEGLDTLLISALTSGPCTSGATNGVLYIGDVTPVVLSLPNDTTICPGNQVTLFSNVSGGVQPYSYNWSTGATTTLITVQPSSTTTYTLQVTDSCNSNVSPQSVTVTVLPPGPVNVVTPDITVCEGKELTLAALVNGGAPAYSYLWTTVTGPDTVPNPTASSNTFIPTANGTYNIVVTDLCGEVGTQTVDVIVDMDCILGIPNVFTPNNDGDNELLVFENLDKFPNSHLVVYNRWGSIVLDESDYLNNWNGGGHADGVYYFVLTVADGRVFPGFVQILGTK